MLIKYRAMIFLHCLLYFVLSLLLFITNFEKMAYHKLELQKNSFVLLVIIYYNVISVMPLRNYILSLNKILSVAMWPLEDPFNFFPTKCSYLWLDLSKGSYTCTVWRQLSLPSVSNINAPTAFVFNNAEGWTVCFHSGLVLKPVFIQALFSSLSGIHKCLSGL